MSTADAEYRAINMALQVVTLMHIIIKYMPFTVNKIQTEALPENMPELNILLSLGDTKMSKFFDLRHHYIHIDE